ncbi:YbaB/EbfC family nucleoid-associated protein [Rhodococcus sp. HNM0569]|uniref:YbaB/EbfC family nucleoid-associated protein n=1 Tax=Rhodococcus sp. HNM0569 TaxID=2716340 RepID=UPI00146D3DDE|nr:YbaB/EbfC family nucleoid-associated protein [Rhodococcus sp. HNM0569]
MISADPGRAAQELDEWAKGLEEKARSFQTLHEQMNATTVTHTSRDGRVRVTVDGNGLPTDITLTDAARGTEPAALSAEIMQCLREARTQLRERVTSLVRGTVGDDEAGNGIVSQYVARFPDPTEDSDPVGSEPCSRQSVARPADEMEDDDYFRNQSFVRRDDTAR